MMVFFLKLNLIAYQIFCIKFIITLEYLILLTTFTSDYPINTGKANRKC